MMRNDTRRYSFCQLSRAAHNSHIGTRLPPLQLVSVDRYI